MPFTTPDLCDDHAGDLVVAEAIFRSFGLRSHFSGEISTIKCFEDNSLVRESVAQNGAGKVLVNDGGGSMRRALLGDMLAEKAVANGWEGVVIYGCLRDVNQINEMALGIKALGTHPMKTDKRGEGQRNIPLQFAGIGWQPGHFVYSDNNGIVVAERKLA